MARIWPTTASRKSRSCEMSSSVAGVLLQPLLQPENRVEVEVVGRLVEQQQVGATGERAGEVEADAPAAGKLRHRSREIGVGETEAVQHLGDARLGRVAADFAVTGMQVADRLAVAAGLGLGQFAFDAAQLDIAVEDEIERAVGQGGGFLGDAGDAPARGQLDGARFGVQFAGEQREQAGLAGAVGADDADLPAGMQLDRGIDDERAAGAGESDLTEGDHEAGDYSRGLLESRHFITRRARHRVRLPPRSRNSSTVRHLLSASLFAFAALAAAAGPAGTDEQQADWERRLERASALQSEGDTKKAEAEKLFEERKPACYRKFLVNRCLEAAYDDYIVTVKEGRRQSNEGKAIERQVKKEQLNARDMQRIADTPQHQAELKEREADTAAARSAAAAEEAATRAKKAQEAAGGCAAQGRRGRAPAEEAGRARGARRRKEGRGSRQAAASSRGTAQALTISPPPRRCGRSTS